MPLSAPAVLTLKALLTRDRLPVALPIVVVDPPVLARVVLPVLPRVVKAPVLAVVAPIALPLMPVGGVLKLLDVTVNALAPVLMLDALRQLELELRLCLLG